MRGSVHLKYLSLIKPFARRMLLGFSVMAVTVVIQLAYPKVVSDFIDNIDIVRSSSWYLWFGLFVLGILVIYSLATALRYYLFESTGLMIVSRVREKLHSVLLKQQIGFYDKNNIGELTNRLSSDVETLQNTLTMGLAISIRSMLVCAGGFVMLVLISPMLSLVLIAFIPVSIFLGRWIGRNIRKRSKYIQQYHAESGKTAHENFSNIKTVHAFNRQSHAQSAYTLSLVNALKESKSFAKYLAGFQGAFSFLSYFVLLLLVWLGAKQIASGGLTIGELTSFVIYSVMVTSSASAISDFWSDWMRAIGATDRVFEIISSEPEESLALGDSGGCSLSGSIRLQNITFAYPERAGTVALENLSLSIKAGEKVALIGASGAGKSTVASLILGFYKPQEGKVLFDDIPVELLSTLQVRDSISIVEQEPSLFSGSIYENIVYGARSLSIENVRPESVYRAAKLAFAHDFIVSFPEGYQTVVGERGVQLSGGQKQRIAIARALVRDPRVLILDEATSALDSASEKKVQKALDNLMEGRTTIMIAHRFSTISKADRVVVLQAGAIVQQGTHKQLQSQDGGLYNRLMGGAGEVSQNKFHQTL